MFEIIFELVFEFLGQLIVEILVQFGVYTAKASMSKRNRQPVLATFGYLVFGAILGLIITLILPNRFFPSMGLGIVTVLVSPVLSGVIMQLWGNRQKENGKEPTNLASWYGGGAFALGLSVVRFLLVRG